MPTTLYQNAAGYWMTLEEYEKRHGSPFITSVMILERLPEGGFQSRWNRNYPDPHPPTMMLEDGEANPNPPPPLPPPDPAELERRHCNGLWSRRAITAEEYERRTGCTPPPRMLISRIAEPGPCRPGEEHSGLGAG